MGSIQLGIQASIGGLANSPDRDILMQDFETVETTPFPKNGSKQTPAHPYADFTFRTYAPVAFRYFRDLFGIQPDDFMVICIHFKQINISIAFPILDVNLQWSNERIV